MTKTEMKTLARQIGREVVETAPVGSDVVFLAKVQIAKALNIPAWNSTARELAEYAFYKRAM